MFGNDLLSALSRKISQNTSQKLWKGRRAVYAVLLSCLLAVSLLTGTGGGRSVRAAQVDAAALSPSVDTVISSVRSYMLANDTNPDFSSIWNVIGMERSSLGAPQSYQDTFYQNLISYAKENNWEFTKTKYSDYSKTILALTAIGIDAQDVMGHNFLAYLSDFTDVKRQGFNGPIWALIALNCHPSYTIPEDSSAEEQTTEEGLITYLLNRELATGGWTLSGKNADTDITAMTVQALAPYYGERDDVTQAVDRALSWLSDNQFSTGGFGTLSGTSGTVETEESAAQVVVALSSLGIDCGTDARFIKNGNWAMSNLFSYYLSEGGFMHVAAGAGNNGGGTAGELDGMATEQGMYATVAYQRLLNGENSLYDMSDVTLTAGEDPGEAAATTAEEEETKAAGTAATLTVKVSSLGLDYSSITVEKGKSKTLTAVVNPSSATNKEVEWTSSNKKVAKVSQSGKVTGKKKGKATITITAKDGSGKTASCAVTVTAASSSDDSSSATATTAAKKATTASGQTKTVGTATAAGGSTDTSSEDSGETEETASEGGWSFAAADYVPESADTASAGDTAEDAGETDISAADAGTVPWYAKSIPVWAALVIGLGIVEIFALIAILLFLRRKGLLHLPRFRKEG